MIILDTTALLTREVSIEPCGVRSTFLISVISPWDRDQSRNKTCLQTLFRERVCMLPGLKVSYLVQKCVFYTAQKVKSSIKNFFSKCDQIPSFLRIWSHILKKFLMENFIFCAVLLTRTYWKVGTPWDWNSKFLKCANECQGIELKE